MIAKMTTITTSILLAILIGCSLAQEQDNKVEVATQEQPPVAEPKVDLAGIVVKATQELKHLSPDKRCAEFVERFKGQLSGLTTDNCLIGSNVMDKLGEILAASESQERADAREELKFCSTWLVTNTCQKQQLSPIASSDHHDEEHEHPVIDGDHLHHHQQQQQQQQHKDDDHSDASSDASSQDNEDRHKEVHELERHHADDPHLSVLPAHHDTLERRHSFKSDNNDEHTFHLDHHNNRHKHQYEGVDVDHDGVPDYLEDDHLRLKIESIKEPVKRLELLLDQERAQVSKLRNILSERQHEVEEMVAKVSSLEGVIEKLRHEKSTSCDSGSHEKRYKSLADLYETSMMREEDLKHKLSHLEGVIQGLRSKLRAAEGTRDQRLESLHELAKSVEKQFHFDQGNQADVCRRLYTLFNDSGELTKRVVKNYATADLATLAYPQQLDQKQLDKLALAANELIYSINRNQRHPLLARQINSCFATDWSSSTATPTYSQHAPSHNQFQAAPQVHHQPTHQQVPHHHQQVYQQPPQLPLQRRRPASQQVHGLSGPFFGFHQPSGGVASASAAAITFPPMPQFPFNPISGVHQHIPAN